MPNKTITGSVVAIRLPGVVLLGAGRFHSLGNDAEVAVQGLENLGNGVRLADIQINAVVQVLERSCKPQQQFRSR